MNNMNNSTKTFVVFLLVFFLSCCLIIIESSNELQNLKTSRNRVSKKRPLVFEPSRKSPLLTEGSLRVSSSILEVYHRGRWGRLCLDFNDKEYFRDFVCNSSWNSSSSFKTSKKKVWTIDSVVNCSVSSSSSSCCSHSCLFRWSSSSSCQSTITKFHHFCQRHHAIMTNEQQQVSQTVSPPAVVLDVGHYDSSLERNWSLLATSSVIDHQNITELVSFPVVDHHQLLLPDLQVDVEQLESSFFLEDKPSFLLECARQEGCLSSNDDDEYSMMQYKSWFERRRLLRFTASVTNVGSADFVSHSSKDDWKWHSCHNHFHSMNHFASFELLGHDDHFSSNVLFVGHKASFCLEDNVCQRGFQGKFRCADKGDQGISVGCSDVYKNNIDCQWIDVSDILYPGNFTFRVSVFCLISNSYHIY